MPMPCRTLGLLALLAAVTPSLHAQSSAPVADAIYTNAQIWTGDATRPRAGSGVVADTLASASARALARL